MRRPALLTWRRDWSFCLLAKRREPQCPMRQGNWMRATRVTREGFMRSSACSDIDPSMVRTISGRLSWPVPRMGRRPLETVSRRILNAELKSDGDARYRRVWPMKCWSICATGEAECESRPDGTKKWNSCVTPATHGKCISQEHLTVGHRTRIH